MADLNAPLVSLYDWMLTIERELARSRPLFPDVYRGEVLNLQSAIRCLRISLEIQVKAYLAQPPPAAPGPAGLVPPPPPTVC